MNRDELIIGHMRLADSLAHKMKSTGILIDDLKQSAYEALINAADTFDDSKGMFFHYAKTCIRNHLILTICNESRTVRIPSTTFSLKTKIYKATVELESQLHRKPSPIEIARYLHIDIKEIDSLSGGACYPLQTDSNKTNYIDILSAGNNVEQEYIKKEDVMAMIKKKARFYQLKIWPRR